VTGPKSCSAITLGRRLRRVGRKMQVSVEARFDAADINYTQWCALHHVRDGATLDSRALAAELEISPASACRVIDGLLGRGLVSRHRDPADPRATVFALTNAGLVTLQHVGPIIDSRNAQALSGLSGDEMETLLHLLDKLTASLELPVSTA